MSNYTKINVRVTGQSIQKENYPLIASGGVNNVKVHFTFCSLWNGLAKTAVFYVDPKQAYKVLLDEDDTAIVPSEVIDEQGEFCVGVFGVNDDQVFPSDYVRVTVHKGAASIEAVDPAEPTPDIYQQIAAAYGRLASALTTQKARLDEILALRGTDGALEYQIDVGDGITGIIRSNGIYATIQLEGLMALSAGLHTYSQAIPVGLVPVGSVMLDCDTEVATIRINPASDENVGATLLIARTTYSDPDISVTASATYPLATISIPELRDIRVAPNGTVYPTAGEAVRARRIPCIVDSGNPNDLADYTAEGEAAIGLLYMNEDTGDLYKCTAFTDGAYVWEPVGGGSCVLTGSGAPNASTAGAVGQLYMDTDSGEMYKLTAVYGTYYYWARLMTALYPASLDFSSSGYPDITPGAGYITLIEADDPAYYETVNLINSAPVQGSLRVTLRTGNTINVMLTSFTYNGNCEYIGIALTYTYKLLALLVRLSTQDGIKCSAVELATVST